MTVKLINYEGTPYVAIYVTNDDFDFDQYIIFATDDTNFDEPIGTYDHDRQYTAILKPEEDEEETDEYTELYAIYLEWRENVDDQKLTNLQQDSALLISQMMSINEDNDIVQDDIQGELQDEIQGELQDDIQAIGMDIDVNDNGTNEPDNVGVDDVTGDVDGSFNGMLLDEDDLLLELGMVVDGDEKNPSESTDLSGPSDSSDPVPFVIEDKPAMIKAIQQAKTMDSKNIIYDATNQYHTIFSQLSSMFQGQHEPLDVAENLSHAYLNITQNYLKSVNPVYKSNRVVYSYLRQIFTKNSKLPEFTKHWLIPIVSDIKKVYKQGLVDIQPDAKLRDDYRASIGLPVLGSGSDNDIQKKLDQVMNEIKEENKIIAPNKTNVNTEYGLNSQYFTSSYSYCAKSGTEQLPANFTRFSVPDHDDQGYTINVIRHGFLSTGTLVIRKARGDIHKVIDKYETVNKSATKTVNVLTGTEHILSLDGEQLNVVGFLRLPIHKNLSMGSSLKFKDIKTINIDEIATNLPALSHKNINQPLAIIFNKSLSQMGQDITHLSQTMDKIIPNLQQVVSVAQQYLSRCSSLTEINDVLSNYDYSYNDLPEDSQVLITNFLRRKMVKKISKFNKRIGQLNNLFEQQKQMIKQMHTQQALSRSPIIEQVLKHPTVIDNYGNYPYWGQLNDTDVNRLQWINRQLDDGNLFYAVYCHVQQSSRVKGQTNASNVSALKSQLDQLTAQLQSANKGLSDSLNDKNLLCPTYRPIMIVVNSIEEIKTLISTQTLTEIKPDQSNVYMYHAPSNSYMSLSAYKIQSAIDTVKLKLDINAQIQQDNIDAPARLSYFDQIITQSKTKLQLLYRQDLRNNRRADYKTAIKTSDVLVSDQSLSALFRKLKSSSNARSREMCLNLIDTQGQLNTEGTWIMDKATGMNKICCAHEFEAIKGLDPISLEQKYLLAGSTECKICSQTISYLDFDTFDGFDADDNVVNMREGGNVVEAQQAQEQQVKQRLLSDIGANDSKISSIVVFNSKSYDNVLLKHACILYEHLYKTQQFFVNASNSPTGKSIVPSVSHYLSSINFLSQTITNVPNILDNVNLPFSDKALDMELAKQMYNMSKNKAKISFDATLKQAEKLRKFVIHMDTYIIYMLSLIVNLELSLPELYLDAKLVDTVIQQHLGKTYTTPSGDQVAVDDTDGNLIGHNFKCFVGQQELAFERALLSKSIKLPMLGKLNDISPQNYFKSVMIDYYQLIKQQPEIATKYSQVIEQLQSQKQNQLDMQQQSQEQLLKSKQLLVEVPKVNPEDIHYDSIQSHQLLLTRLRSRCLYAHKLIDNTYKTLLNLVEEQVAQQIPIETSTSQPKQCYTKPTHYYTDYIINQVLSCDAKEYNLKRSSTSYYSVNTGLHNANVELPSDISSIVQSIINSSSVQSFSQTINSLCTELLTLNKYIDQHSQFDRLKVCRCQPQNIQTIHSGELSALTPNSIVNISKHKTVKSLKPKLNPVVNPLGSLIPIDQLDLQYNKYSVTLGKTIKQVDESQDVSVLIDALQSLATYDNIQTALDHNTKLFIERFNHKWNSSFVPALFRQSAINAKSISLHSLKSHFNLLHYCVSMLNTKHDVIPVYPEQDSLDPEKEINEKVYNFILNTQSQLDEFNLKDLFKSYSQSLHCHQINNLVPTSTTDSINIKDILGIELETLVSPSSPHSQMTIDQCCQYLRFYLIKEITDNLINYVNLSTSRSSMDIDYMIEAKAFINFVVDLLAIMIDTDQVVNTTNDELLHLREIEKVEKFRHYQLHLKSKSGDKSMLDAEKRKAGLGVEVYDPREGSSDDLEVEPEQDVQPTLDEILMPMLGNQVQGEIEPEQENLDSLGDEHANLGYD